jgi:hypothetical protein
LPAFAVGRHAQHRFGAKQKVFDDACAHDDEVISRVINLATSDPAAERRRLHDQVEREARGFVDRHWPEIEKLGNVLFERGRLDKHEIEVVLAPPEPEFRRRSDGFIKPIKELDPSVELSYHEASHAVVAAALGQKIRKVALDKAGGFCRVAQPSTMGNRKALLDFCTVACAGALAVSRLTGVDRVSMGDHRAMECKLAEAGTLVEAISILREARRLAEQIVSARWSDIATVARRLHQRGELDGAEVADLLSGFRVAA